MTSDLTSPFSIPYRCWKDADTITFERDEFARILRFVEQMATYRARAHHSEWMAEQCRKLADERPWSTEAETLRMIAHFAEGDSGHFREAAIDCQVSAEVDLTDLDKEAARLPQT